MKKSDIENNLLHLPTLSDAEAIATMPPEIKSFLQLDADSKLPPVPVASILALKDQLKNIMFMYACTPGLVDGDLTDQDLKRLSPLEAGLYNLMKKLQTKEVGHEILRYVMDMTVGPPTQQTKSIQIKGDVKDWRDMYYENKEEIDVDMQEARAIQAKKREEFLDVVDVESDKSAT